ncbi:MAG TPA: HTH domain-containing protein [Solirubrobacteraceae bacterium]
MVDATKIAKLRAKALSTGYPQEAAMFERKASELAAHHGIADADIKRALTEIFGHRLPQPAPPPPRRSSPPPPRQAPQHEEPVENADFPTMIEAVIFVLEAEHRPMRARELWTVIEGTGIYRSNGKTPWATIGAKLATQTDRFERVAPGFYRLREAA